MEQDIGLIDLDGSVADFDGQMRNDIKLLMGPDEEPIDPWDRTKPWIRQRKQLIMRQPGWWANLPKYKLGFDILDVLLNMGFECHVLTKGPSASEIAWAEKVEWCKKNLPSEVKITITENKSLMYGKVLLDDWPGYVEPWLEKRPRGLVVLPAQKHNEGFEHPNAIRYDGTNFDEVVERIIAQKKRKPGEK